MILALGLILKQQTQTILATQAVMSHLVSMCGKKQSQENGSMFLFLTIRLESLRRCYLMIKIGQTAALCCQLERLFLTQNQGKQRENRKSLLDRATEKKQETKG